MIEVRPVTVEDIVPLLEVEVRDDQDGFVAPNVVTIAQARFEAAAYDFVLWDGDRRVGMIALIDMAEHEARLDFDSPEAAYVWRLLVGAEDQGRGHGRAAMLWAEDWARARGRRLMQVQAVAENAPTIGFYESLGYRQTGVVVEGEVQLEKPL